LAVSTLPAFQWPIFGGLLVDTALIPIWIWIGAALGHRVAVSRTSSRPALGATIVAGAAYAVITTLLAVLQFRLGHVRLSTMAAAGSALAGLLAYRRLINAQGSPGRDRNASG
jgi:hypothetical protein